MVMNNPDVVIIGAGLAGICCARALSRFGVPFQIVEASDGIGGRVRSDLVEGFILDRGFQLLLTAYPEALDQLDYDALGLRPFVPGALIRHRGKFIRLADPGREAGAFLGDLFSPIGSLSDKFRLWRLRSELHRKSIEDIFAAPETSTLQALRERGFSQRGVQNFFQSFFGGVMLDSKLTVSSRMFEFVFKMMLEGDSALPARGMGAIPEQLVAGFPAGSVRLNARVKSIALGEVMLESGEAIRAKSIVVATEGPEACQLLGSSRTVNSRSVSALYFAARQSPLEEPIIVVNGGSRGPITNVCVPNLVQPGYAPEGESLVSVSVVGWPTSDDKILVNMVRSQLRRWYGLVAEEWRLLRIYRIHHAHPVVSPMEWQQPQRLSDGLYLCGDHRSTPTIQGAMESGRLAAQAIARDFGVYVEQDAAESAEPAPEHPAGAGPAAHY